MNHLEEFKSTALGTCRQVLLCMNIAAINSLRKACNASCLDFAVNFSFIFSVNL